MALTVPRSRFTSSRRESVEADLLSLGFMDTPQKVRPTGFWKIYGLVMAVDLLIYVLIFYLGRAIPPASPATSYPGNYGLALAWLVVHFPAALIFFIRDDLPDNWMWILILQDAWLAAWICLWTRRKTR